MSNGRIRNIGGCPGDSVIYHRITFENGTWNEATTASTTTAFCGNEAGPRWVPGPRVRRDGPQLPLAVSARDPRQRGRRCACPGTPVGTAPRAPGLGGFREDARPPKQAEAAAGLSRLPRALTCPLALGRWQSTTSGDPGMREAGGDPRVFLLHSCLASSYPVPSSPRAPCMPPHPRVRLGVRLRGVFLSRLAR